MREGRMEQFRRAEIDFDAAGGVDLDRLERSLGLAGERVGDGTGGGHEHWVDLYTSSMPRCDCGDHLWRERICKHILAALLREGNDRVIGALSGLVARARQAA
jgi:SWIM zinc finger